MIDHTMRVRITGHRLSARTQSAHAVLSILTVADRAPDAAAPPCAMQPARAPCSACRRSLPQPRGPQVPASAKAVALYRQNHLAAVVAIARAGASDPTRAPLCSRSHAARTDATRRGGVTAWFGIACCRVPSTRPRSGTQGRAYGSRHADSRRVHATRRWAQWFAPPAP